MTAIEVNFDEAFNIREYEVDPSWKKYAPEGYGEYRRNWEKASGGFVFRFPLCIEIESSYNCNLKCPMCARQVLGIFGEKGLMDRKLYSKIIAEAAKRGMPAIMLDHEAEPLCNPHIADMAKEAKKGGVFDIWMHTNANLLTEETSEKLLKSGLTKINFSVDAASAEAYNKIRPGGDFNTVIKNIMGFLKLKEKFNKRNIRTRVSFVIQEANRREREAFFEFWKDKVNLISFQALKDLTKFKNKDADFGKRRDDFICYKPWQLLIIRYNGDIVPCGLPLRQYDAKDYLLGNLRANTIEECWNSAKLNKIRKLHTEKKYYKLPFCRACVSSFDIID